MAYIGPGAAIIDADGAIIASRIGTPVIIYVYAMKQWIVKILLAGLMPAVFFFIFEEGSAGDYTAPSELRLVGGDLPRETKRFLLDLNKQLRASERIFKAERNNLVVLLSDGTARDYEFFNNCLWLGHDPAITSVDFFNFDYRNNSGRIISRAGRFSGDITSISYTMKIKSKRGGFVYVSSSVSVNAQSSPGTRLAAQLNSAD